MYMYTSIINAFAYFVSDFAQFAVISHSGTQPHICVILLLTSMRDDVVSGGKRPAEAVPADATDDTLKQSGAPAATNGAVPEPKTHKLGRMRRFRNSLSDLMKSKRSKPWRLK